MKVKPRFFLLALTVIVLTNYQANSQGWNVEPMGSIGFADIVYDVALSGNYAYLANNTMGLRVIDVSDPYNPVSVGWLDTPGYAMAVFKSGIYAYVASGSSGLCIVNVAEPTTPLLAGTYDTQESSLDVMVYDNIAYIADFFGDLLLVDVTYPISPQYLSFCYNS
jgi:hypothetical protein